MPLYLHNVERWHPTVFFGRYQDDSIYFSSAKALAEGRGYIIPSFPGAPAQTKYPIVYPWLLSFIWKWHPAFPENLKQGVRLTEFFGCWSLLVSFLLLRKLPGIGQWPALFLVALCAVSPIFLRLSGVVMTEVPFMALLLTAALLADSAKRQGAAALCAIATGVVAGLSVGMRTIGIAVVAGILLAALWRRAYRQAILFCAAAGFVMAIESWPMLFHRTAAESQTTGEPGWQQVWVYYTNYAAFWRMSVPGIGAFLRMVKSNLLLLISAPGPFVVAPLSGPTTVLRTILFSVLTVLIVAGIVRRERGQEWKPIHFVLLVYCAVLLVWPFPQMDRFLLPFLPLFFAGLWVETPRIVALLRANLGQGTVLPPALAAGVAAILVGVFGFTLWDYLIVDPRLLQLAAASRAHPMDEKRQAYKWIREHTDPGVRIAASDDAVLYLYTGRQALRPVVFLPSGDFMSDKRILAHDLAHITDAARHVGAQFWLTSDDEAELKDRDLIAARMAEIKSVLPVVFHSRDNTVQVRDASCLLETQRADCQAALPVLFPPEP